LLADACRSFREHLVVGIEPNLSQIQDFVTRSLMLVTALTPHIGYDRAAVVAKTAHAEGKTLRDVCVELGFLTATEFDDYVRPEGMTHPGAQRSTPPPTPSSTSL
jgi:fumarate hydratase class II